MVDNHETEWIREQVRSIQLGESFRQRCVMSTPDRVSLALCHGDIPEDRVAAGHLTCSPACQAAKRRLRREFIAKRKCRFCGHGFTKKEREQRTAERRASKIPVAGKGEVPDE